jgi:hypothetical protein
MWLKIGDEGGDKDPEPADGLAFLCVPLARAEGAIQRPVDEPDEAGDYKSHSGRSDEGMRDSAMMLEADDRSPEGPEDVEVGRFGSEGGSERGVGGAAVEACATNAGSGEEVGDWLHK